MNGSVFPSFHPILKRTTPAAHAATSYPCPPCWGFVVFAGDVNADSTGQLNTILTLYEIANPPVHSSKSLQVCPSSLLAPVTLACLCHLMCALHFRSPSLPIPLASFIPRWSVDNMLHNHHLRPHRGCAPFRADEMKEVVQQTTDSEARVTGER